MLKKYSKDVVLNYINGTDAEDFDVNDLENNPTFMLDVLSISKDEKMYEFASDDVKMDYNFCINVIEMFKNDHKFVKKVAQRYLLSEKNDYMDRCDVIITLSNILKNDEDDAAILYNSKAFSMFIDSQIDVENILERKNTKEKYGLGFYYIEMMYGTKPVVEEYFAQKMIEELFLIDNEDRLKMFLHKKYKDVKELEEIGLNNILINAIRAYDVYLSGYASSHLNILKNLRVKLHDIMYKWDYYNENRTYRKKEIVYQYISRCVDNGLCEGFNPYFILDEVASSYHLEKYLDSEPLKVRENEFNFAKEVFKKKLTLLVKQLFIEDVIDEYYDEHKKSQIISLNNKSS